MVANILKYGSDNLIIFYYCTYSELSGTARIIVQNSIKLIRYVEFGPYIDRWLECNLYWKSIEGM